MSEDRKVKLSLDKFINLLEKNGYILSAVYCNEQNIRFAECRTPRQQKTFIVYLPNKYVMTYPKESSGSKGSLKRLNISSTNHPPSSRQIEFMSDMKGLLLECDLIAISSESVCVYKNTNSAQCFDIIDPEAEKSEEIEEEILESEDLSKVSALEKDTLNILKKVKGPKAKLPKASLGKPKSSPSEKKGEKKGEKKEEEEEFVEEEEEFVEEEEEFVEEEEEFVEEEEESTDKKEKITKEEGGELIFDDDIEKETPKETPKPEDTAPDIVELIFEDEDGEPVDEVKTMLDAATAEAAEASIRDIRAKVKKRDRELGGNKDDKDADEEEFHSIDNSFPPNLEDSELILGIIYVMIDIGIFFRKIAVYEEEVITCYEQLDENELEMRSKRLSKIKEITMNFLKHSEERLEKISQEEKDLKVQLIRLTVVLAQASALKSRIAVKPEKYGDIVNESDRIYQHTRNTIYELNMELLKLRDSADELLSNYRSSIEELMDM